MESYKPFTTDHGPAELLHDWADDHHEGQPRDATSSAARPLKTMKLSLILREHRASNACAKQSESTRFLKETRATALLVRRQYTL